MLYVISRWLQRHLSDPQALLLLGFLLSVLALLLLAAGLVGPVLAALILAYLLDWPVMRLNRWRVPRFMAVLLVFLVFVSSLLVFLIGILPLLGEQSLKLLQQLPSMLEQGRLLMRQLPAAYPELISTARIDRLFLWMANEFGNVSQQLLSYSLSSLPGLIHWALYLVLIPTLVFLLLKDKYLFLTQLQHWLPHDRRLLQQILSEMNRQMGNYVRGKIVEIFIVGAASYVLFSLTGLNFALLLAVLAGLSVLIPVIGALAVTVPVCLVAYFQWGWSAPFGYLLLGHSLIQLIDGYLLVPLVFAESVNLHPMAIILAIWTFGNLWGFWGVFFAIPLATLIKAIVHFWPSRVRVV